MSRNAIWGHDPAKSAITHNLACLELQSIRAFEMEAVL